MAFNRRRHFSEHAEPELVENVEEEETCSNDEMQDPYTFKDKGRPSVCLRGFQELYESQQLFDMTLRVDEKEFECHKSLLASSSDYFRAMFTTDLSERDQKVVCINGVDATSMELVIKYLYSGEAQLQSETVQNLLSAANLFQLKELRDGCATYMARKLDVENCIGIHFFAQAHECEHLEFEAWDVITDNFTEVADSTEFLELTSDNLVEIIKYDDIQCTEEEIFDAVIKWLEYDASARSSQIFNLFSYVRLLLIDDYYFYDKIVSNTFIQSEPRMEALLEEVTRFALLKNRLSESDMRLEPRYGADYCRVIAYTAYQDDDKKQVMQLYGQRSEEIIRTGNTGLCDLPPDVENPAVLVTGDNELYVAGGDGCGATMYKWVVEDGQFEEMASMSDARKQFSLVMVDKCIYVLGGCNHQGHLASMFKYNEATDEWEKAEAMPKALRCFCSVAFRGKLYVFGGEYMKASKKGYNSPRKADLNSHALCYSPREDKWTVLAEMSTPRALAGCSILHNKIYVVGGFSTLTDSWFKEKSPEHCLASVEIYDPQTNSWTQGPDLPTPLCAMGVVKYYGTIYVLGGENDEDVNNSVYYLNVDDNKWDLKDEMITGVTETSIHSQYSVLNVDIGNE